MTSNPTISFEELVEKLKSLETALIASHISPDADAVASSCGLAVCLQLLGVRTTVYSVDRIPRKLQTLIRGMPVSHEVPRERFGAFIGIDTAAKKRLGPDADALISLCETSFNIDHHESNEIWAAANYVDSSAAASSEIVAQFASALNLRPDHKWASLVLAGLADDTGSFRFSNTTARAHRVAAQLIDLGAEPALVANEIYFTTPQNVLGLRAKALAGLHYAADGRVAIVRITQQLLTECSATAEDTDGIVEEARMAEGVLCAVLMRELSDGWKFSLRSKTESLDVNEVASAFGGGGHRAAAGCKISGPPPDIADDAEAQILARIEAALSEAS